MKILICDCGQYGFEPFLRVFQTALQCEAEFLEIGDMQVAFSAQDLYHPDHQSDDITDYYASLIKHRIIKIKPDIILFEISRFVEDGQAGWGWGFDKMTGYLQALGLETNARIIIWTVLSASELDKANFTHPFIEKPCYVPQMCRILQRVINVPNYPRSILENLEKSLIVAQASPDEIQQIISAGNLVALQEVYDNFRASYISAFSDGVPEELILEAMNSGDWNEVERIIEENRQKAGK